MLATSFPDPAGPVFPFINGLLEMAGFNRIGPGLSRPVVCLAQNVAEHPVVGGQFALVCCQPAGMFNQPGHGASLQRSHFQAPGHGGDHARVEFIAFFIAVQVVLEIRFYFEQVQKVGIIVGQQVIEHPVPEQNHLDRHRNGLRLQADGTHQSIEPLQGLDADFAGGQDPLEAFPGHRLG